MGSDTQKYGLIERLKLALGRESVNKFASRCEFSESSVRQYLSGSVPGADKAAIMAEKLNVTLDWLIAGRGAMRPGESDPMAVAPAVQEPPGISEAVDEELMALLVDGIMAVYKDVNVGLPPRDLGRLAERMRGDLVESYTDPDERRVAVKGMLRQLRRSLQEAPVDAGGKRRV